MKIFSIFYLIAHLTDTYKKFQVSSVLGKTILTQIFSLLCAIDFPSYLTQKYKAKLSFISTKINEIVALPQLTTMMFIH